jgi:signal peptidase
MMIATLRGAITAILVVAVIGCVALVAFTRVTDAVIVVGGSMEPAIPRGSLISPTRVSDSSLSAGTIVTVVASNGVLVTHRINRVLDLAEGRFLELRGDANSGADPALVPASSVIGRVDWHVPGLGYLAGLLGTPLGMLSVLALLLSGICALWLVEDLEIQGQIGERRRSSATSG